MCAYRILIKNFCSEFVIGRYYYVVVICDRKIGKNILMIYTIYPCPVSFCPSVYFAPVSFSPLLFPPPPGNCLIIYAIYRCPVSFCPLDSFYPLSFCPLSFCPLEIVSWFTLFTHVSYHFAPLYHFAPRIILPPIICAPPPEILWMYTIYSCSVSFCPLIILPPGNCFMIYTVYPCPVSFCTLDSFCPHIILPPGHGLMIYTIYLCPVSFCHCIRLRFHTNEKPFTTKAYDRRASGDCGTSGSVFLCLLRSIVADRDHLSRVCLSVRVSVCLSVCLCVCPIVTLSW